MPIDRASVEQIVREIVLAQVGGPPGKPNLVVSISARHVHLTDEDVETLFGAGHKLTPMKDLYQDGFYAAEETVMVVGPAAADAAHGADPRPHAAARARWSWPSPTAFRWASTCRSAPAARSTARPAACWSGPKGVVELKKGVIRAERHVHMRPADAEYYGVKRRRPHEPARRRRPAARCSRTCWCGRTRTIKLEVHLDTDEGNACDIDHASRVEL